MSPLYFFKEESGMNKLVIAVVGAVTVAAASAAMSIITTVQNHRMMKKIGKSLEKVEERSEEQIAESLIQKSVEKAADKKVDLYMMETENAVLNTARKDLEIQARNAVVSAGNDIREKAAAEISHQVALLDIEQLKRRVCEQAEKHVVEKFDGCLDSSLKKFQDQLDNTRKIYDGISRAMAEKDRKDDGGLHVVMF